MSRSITIPAAVSERGRALQDLAIDIRRVTLQLFDTFSDAELFWAPAGTSNHGFWHAGHACWLQDVLCWQLIHGASMLPDDWPHLFGMGSKPAEIRDGWPARKMVREQLRSQLPKLLELLATVRNDDWDKLPLHAHPGDTRTLWQCASHGWHDEAKHQGEMYLLLKMLRGTV
jgi:hypothetical protein